MFRQIRQIRQRMGQCRVPPWIAAGMVWALLTLSGKGEVAYAGNVTLHFGPASLGRGGPNPLSIPPTVADIGILQLGGGKGNREIYVSLVPGIFLWGYRTSSKPGPYFALGGGLISSANGLGVGAYAAAGVDFFCGRVCFNLDYRKAIGLTGSGVVSPYSIRFGGVFWY